MASFKTKWQACKYVLDACRLAGGCVTGFDDSVTAVETASFLFDAFGVGHDDVLWHPVGGGVCLCLHNAGSGAGVTGYVLADGPKVLSFMKSMALTDIEFRSLHECKRLVTNCGAALSVTGTRVFCFWKHSRRVMLALYVEKDRVQIEKGGEIRLISDTCTRVVPVRERDQAFDELWNRGRNDFTGYMAALGSMARLQRKINGQRNVKGVVTAASKDLGPAVVIGLEEAREPASEAENGIPAHIMEEIEDYGRFLRVDMDLPEAEAAASVACAVRNASEGRHWKDDGE